MITAHYHVPNWMRLMKRNGWVFSVAAASCHLERHTCKINGDWERLRGNDVVRGSINNLHTHIHIHTHLYTCTHKNTLTLLSNTHTLRHVHTTTSTYTVSSLSGVMNLQHLKTALISFFHMFLQVVYRGWNKLNKCSTLLSICFWNCSVTPFSVIYCFHYNTVSVCSWCLRRMNVWQNSERGQENLCIKTQSGTAINCEEEKSVRGWRSAFSQALDLIQLSALDHGCVIDLVIIAIPVNGQQFNSKNSDYSERNAANTILMEQKNHIYISCFS